MTDQDVIDRAHKAERLLNDPLLADAFEGVRKAIFTQIENNPIGDREALHEWRIMLKLLRDVKANLESAIRDGKVIAARANEAEKTSKLRRLFNR